MSKLLRFKMDSDALKPRRCLMCGGFFASEGPHNRICRKCRSSQIWRDGF